MILSRSDLRLLTGRKCRKLMLAELDAMGIHYAIGLDGYPRVLADHVADVLAGRSGTRRRTRPNFEAANG